MAIGVTIRRLRLKKGLSQERLAELVGCSGPAVTMWERENRPTKPRLDRLRILAKALDVGYDELLNSYLGRRA